MSEQPNENFSPFSNDNQGLPPADEPVIQRSKYIRLEQINAWNDCGYPVEMFGKTPSVILLGEIHSDVAQQQKQAELIAQLRPAVILHEILSGFMYDPKSKKFVPLAGRKFDSEDRILMNGLTVPRGINDVVNTFGIPIIGCDTTQAEEHDIERKIAALHPDMYRYKEFKGTGRLIKRGDPDWMLIRGDDLQMPFRDAHMARMIREWEGKTDTPLIVILGAEHAGNIRDGEFMKDKTFDYIYVDQSLKQE